MAAAVDRMHLNRGHWDFSRVEDPSWFGGSAAVSHWFDAYTMLVPENEQFYIRTLRTLIADATPSERQTLRKFFSQESRHGTAHTDYVRRMHELGLRTQGFTRAVNYLLYSILEPIQPHALRMSLVAAIEHLNAFMAHIMLSRDMFSCAPESMRDLFYWHFAEEIEHKCVAHDFLVQRYPGYWTRVSGGVLGFLMFYCVSFLGMCVLLKQRRRLLSRRTFAELYKFWIKQGVLRASLAQMGRYFSRSFDPRDQADDDLVCHARLRAGTNQTT